MTLKAIQGGSQKKKRPSSKEIFDKYFDGSKLTLSARFSQKDNSLDFLYMEFHGLLSAIPSLKSSYRADQNTGSVYMDRDCRQKLRAMDAHFRAAKERLKLPNFHPLSFGKREISLVVINGRRSRTFDSVSPLETVADWFECSKKMKGGKKKERGWGVGLIDDDKQVIPLPLRARHTNYDHDHTTILAVPFDKVREECMKYLTAHYLSVEAVDRSSGQKEMILKTAIAAHLHDKESKGDTR